jgi:NitT/TauT family transport system permease protein
MATLLEPAALPSRPKRMAPRSPGLPGRRVWLPLAQNVAPPLLWFGTVVTIWQVVCTLMHVPKYLVPKPSDVMTAAVLKADILSSSVLSSFTSALIGLSLSIVFGTAVALALSQSKVLERAVFPCLTVVQTVPFIAYAPMLVIWFGAGESTIVAIVFIISLFPIIANTTAGLTSTDHNLVNMFELYNANWWQRTVKLKLPAALPYIMAGLRISSGMAVIGAVVGEFIAGMGGLRGGLGFLIASSAARIEMGTLFAAAAASSLLGIIIFIAVNLTSTHFLRHWHESAVQRET